MRKRGASTLQSEVQIDRMRLTAAANKKPVKRSTTTIAIRQNEHPLADARSANGRLRSDHSPYERRKEDAEQGRKYAAAGAYGRSVLNFVEKS